MSIHDAMVADTPTLRAEDPVARGLEVARAAGASAVPVVDDTGRPVGVFGARALLRHLLPVSIPVDGAPEAATREVLDAAPGLVKRLAKVEALTVGEVMGTQFTTIAAHAPLAAAARALLAAQGPLLALAPDGRLAGVITGRSFFAEVGRLQRGGAA
jgi:CBS domain-containing protein